MLSYQKGEIESARFNSDGPRSGLLSVVRVVRVVSCGFAVEYRVLLFYFPRVIYSFRGRVVMDGVQPSIFGVTRTIESNKVGIAA